MRRTIYRLRYPFLRALLLATIVFFLSFLLIVQVPPTARAQSITDQFTGDPSIPWHISADTIGYDIESQTYHAKGNVVIEKKDVRLVADTVVFNNLAMTASASGHILMKVGDDVLTGNRIELDLGRETGVLHGGAVFLKENHFIIRGDRIEKTGKDTYRTKNGTVTTCDGDRPDWQLHGRTVNVTIEGYGTATHATFNVRKVPILYAPYLFFPVKTKRQTGLLLPEAGASSRKGVNWDQPFFWAINDYTDATLNAHYMEKRGTMIGLEYRYALGPDSHGTIMADGMEDRKIDDGTPDNTSNWGYAGDDYDRTNTDRYWFRAKVDQQLPWKATAKLDLDIVSDQDYLTEFKDGQTGFDETRDAFRRSFGRDIDTYDESTRKNRFNINRIWSKFTFNGDFLWYDNVTNRRWEETDDTLQQLPTIQFDAAKQQAFDTSFFWDLNSEYTYFYREDGDRGQRVDILPRAYLPYRWKNYLSLEPSIGWRQTAWQMDSVEDESLDRSTYRQLFDAQLDLSTEIEKVMASPLNPSDRIRHRLTPRIVYSYVPNQDQSDLPDFTDTDRIDKANSVTYSLTNIFTARHSDIPSDTFRRRDTDFFENENVKRTSFQNIDSGTGNLYNRFCRFYLAQSYDFTEQDQEDDSSFSDIFGELDFNFGRTFVLDSDANFDTYEGRFSSHNVAASVSDRRGDRLWVEHRYQRSTSESIRAALSLRLTDRVTARGKYERNLKEGIDIIKGVGFLYTAQCWSFDFFYAVEGNDNKFSFFINLMGIGGFGQE